jgi:hypothetical protein
MTVLQSREKRRETLQWPKGQTTIYKTLHITLLIEEHEPH